jgi:hypothetical protein
MERLIPGPEADGRIKIGGILTQNQIKSLTNLEIEALKQLSYSEMATTPTETWIDYWFDKDKISEAELRSIILVAIDKSK